MSGDPVGADAATESGQAPPPPPIPPLTPEEKAAIVARIEAPIAALNELRQLGKRWVTWRYVVRGTKKAKPTKVPHTASGRRASSTSQSSWATYEACRSRFLAGDFHGLGIMLQLSEHLGEPEIVGIDIDDCIDEDGGLSPLALEITTGFSTYTEVSPSGRGLRIFFKGVLPPGIKGRRNDKLGIEVYSAERFLTLTGNILPGPSRRSSSYRRS